VAWAETGSRYLLLINILLIVTYLISAGYTSNTAKLSIQELLKGPTAFMFWGGLVFLGLAVPAGVAIVSLFSAGEVSSVLLIIAVTAHTLGAFALKYCLLKVGIYRPLLPRVAAY
jgi:formate-dependent nitrite reductase membrane component NrfD